MTRTSSAILAIALALSTSPAFPLTPDVLSVVQATGQCTKFKLGGVDYSCKQMFYQITKNGQASFSFDAGASGLFLILQGSNDSQLSPERYTLKINLAIVTSVAGGTRGYPASGICRAAVSTDGKYLHSTSCRASNGLETIEVDFKGDGRPVFMQQNP